MVGWVARLTASGELVFCSLDESLLAGRTVNPAQISGWLVIYCYPMTGRYGRSLPNGWVRALHQSCSFRDKNIEDVLSWLRWHLTKMSQRL